MRHETISGPIRLLPHHRLSTGTKRDVYRHPERDDLLIKVFNAKFADFTSGPRPAWYRPSRRFHHWTTVLREINETIAMFIHFGSCPRHLQWIHGFIETNLGLAEVVERKSLGDEFLAPTLDTLIRQGRFDDHAKREYQIFCDWLLAAPVVVSDIHKKNIVFATDQTGKPAFSIVDGLGETTFIPVKSMIPAVNRRKKHRSIATMNAKIQKMGVRLGTGSTTDRLSLPAPTA